MTQQINCTRPRGKPETVSERGLDMNGERIEFAKASIAEMASEAIRTRQNGTIGIEISIKDGKLGKVKRLLIDFQPE